MAARVGLKELVMIAVTKETPFVAQSVASGWSAASSCSAAQSSSAALLPNISAAPGFSEMSASTGSHRPIKGILKNKVSSFSSVEAPVQQYGQNNAKEVHRKKSQKWDEASILATFNPSHHDYNLKKVNQPVNPHLQTQDDGEDLIKADGTEALTPDMLAEKVAAMDTFGTCHQKKDSENNQAYSNKHILTKVERQRQFEMRRKLNCSEGFNIQLARQLIWEELQAEAEEDEKQQPTTTL
ncbi:protein phosphatase inhibitor 2 family member C [Perognathus longimembris pacificus]|uniref:protein phosphatase inhibitor 2 family member C n=1 Tax=Perognathus longimembris pacificus TaxID=214514 RepID=UPI002018F5C2|nr:protein phosphatase inhibitor 2 family member C [Perognathus longimembris pacificus]